MKKTDHAVLKYQVLSILKEQAYSPKQITEKLADFFGLTQEEREECYPDRPWDKVFYKRVASNEQHLQAARLIEFINGDHFITNLGLSALNDNRLNKTIDYNYLRTFPGYMEWKGEKKIESKETDNESSPIINQIDPDITRYDILSFLKDKKSHTQSEIVEHLANAYELTKEEREEKYTNGNLKFYKCIAGIEQQLKRAGLETFDSNNHTITEKGIRLLEKCDGAIRYDELQNRHKFVSAKEEVFDFKTQKGNDNQPHYESFYRNGCSMFVIPRNEFNKTTDKAILKHPCLYILLDEISENANCYIGQTGDPIERISTHRSTSKGEDFWSYALVFVYYNPKDDTHFDLCDVAYLEYLAYYSAQPIYNKKGVDEPYIKPMAKELIGQVFNDIKTLISGIGLQLFD